MQENVIALLRCPRCGGAITRRGGSLLCPRGHCYDISRYGDVNFAPEKRESFYTKALFESRARVFAAGVFDSVIAAIDEELAARLPGERPAVLVDAGCGEGFYTRRVLAGTPITRIGFDLCKEAVRLAARGGKEASFFVGDLARIPLADGCADVLLDVFTPANYAQFARVLRPGGVIVKLAPRAGYLAELREAARGLLRRGEHDGAPVERYAQERMTLLCKRDITYTLPVDAALAADLARMTPMLAGIDTDRLDLSAVTRITVDETLMVGTPRTAD